MSGAEAYGRPAQRTLLRKGAALFSLLRGDPRFTYYGRGVGVADAAAGGVALALDLVAVQGSGHVADVPDEALDETIAAFEAEGLSVTRYVRWVGGTEAVRAARALVGQTALPEDLEVLHVGPETPAAAMEALAEATSEVGVMALAGGVLRGTTHTGLAVLARERSGRVVSAGAAARVTHPAHPTRPAEAWWGILATRPDRQGARLALRLGVLALVEMAERHGAERFMTGVQPGNAPSEAVCRRMGLLPEPASVVTAVDPAALEGGRLTR